MFNIMHQKMNLTYRLFKMTTGHKNLLLMKMMRNLTATRPRLPITEILILREIIPKIQLAALALEGLLPDHSLKQ